MSESRFSRMLFLSVAIHLAFLAVLTVTFKRASKPITFPTFYAVNLVEDAGKPAKGVGVEPPSPAKQAAVQPSKQRAPSQTVKPVPEQKKAKPVAQPKETTETARSLSPKKLPAKETPSGTTQDELQRLDERIKEMRKRTAAGGSGQEESRVGQAAPRGVGGGSGTVGLHGGSGSGGHNPALARYLVAMRNRIESAWHIPFVSGAKKNLEARVTVKIRSDGRIVDINLEKRSGNRPYDESVMRVLRAIDPLPPVPASVEEDPLEVEMTLRPEGVS